MINNTARTFLKRYEAVFDRGWQHEREEAGYDEEGGGGGKCVWVCGTVYDKGRVVRCQFYQILMHRFTTKKKNSYEIAKKFYHF